MSVPVSLEREAGRPVYERLFLAGILVSVLYLLAAPKVRKLMHGVH
jgi:hypothetical protein